MDMNIKSIIEEYLKAQEAYRIAEEKISVNLADVHKEKAKIQDEVWEKAKKHVANEKIKLTLQLEKAQAERQTHYQVALDELEKKFNVSKNEWQKVIFDRCLNRSK